jgi:hypothetical protein
MDDLAGDLMTWLRAGVPVTLLLDLAARSGPDSAAIFAAEPADLAWTRAHTAA